MKWEDSWMLQRPFVYIAARLLRSHEYGNYDKIDFKGDSGRPIVDVNFAAIHFDKHRKRCHAEGLPVPTASRKDWDTDLTYWRIGNETMHSAIDARCNNLRRRRYEVSEWGEDIEDWWPSFSLRPGFTRADLVLKVGEFPTDPIMWPYFFETKWACDYYTINNDTYDGFVIMDADNFTVRNVSQGSGTGIEHSYDASHAKTCEGWCGLGNKDYLCVEERCKGCGDCDVPDETKPAPKKVAETCGQWCGLTPKSLDIFDHQDKCGLVWFTHIPRTGGESVQQIFYDHDRAATNAWTWHDSLHVQYEGPNHNTPRNDWDLTEAWQNLSNALLNKKRPKEIMHHGMGMPGLSDKKLRAWLVFTKQQLELKGCNLWMTTVLRSPVSRAISAAEHDEIMIGSEEIRAFAHARHDFMTGFLVWHAHNLRLHCRPERLALDRYAQFHNETAPDFCFFRETAPLEQAKANLALYDIVGNTEDIKGFADAVAHAIEEALPDDIPYREKSSVHRGISVADAFNIAQENLADLELYKGMCASHLSGACNDVRKTRSEEHHAAWDELRTEKAPYDYVAFWKPPFEGEHSNTSACTLLEEYAEASGYYFDSSGAHDHKPTYAQVICADRHKLVKWPGLTESSKSLNWGKTKKELAGASISLRNNTAHYFANLEKRLAAGSTEGAMRADLAAAEEASALYAPPPDSRSMEIRDFLKTPVMPGTPVPAPRTLQIVIVRNPLDHAVRRWYVKAISDLPRLGCKAYYEASALATKQAAELLSGPNMGKKRCELDLLPTEAQVNKWAEVYPEDIQRYWPFWKEKSAMTWNTWHIAGPFETPGGAPAKQESQDEEQSAQEGRRPDGEAPVDGMQQAAQQGAQQQQQAQQQDGGSQQAHHGQQEELLAKWKQMSQASQAQPSFLQQDEDQPELPLPPHLGDTFIMVHEKIDESVKMLGRLLGYRFPTFPAEKDIKHPQATQWPEQATKAMDAHFEEIGLYKWYVNGLDKHDEQKAELAGWETWGVSDSAQGGSRK